MSTLLHESDTPSRRIAAIKQRDPTAPARWAKTNYFLLADLARQYVADIYSG